MSPIETIVALGAAAASAEMCTAAWSAGGIEHVVRVPDRGSRCDAIARAVLTALEHRMGDAAAGAPARGHSGLPIQKFTVTPAEIEAISSRTRVPPDSVQAAAAGFVSAQGRVRVILVMAAAAADRTYRELEAVVELIGRAALAEIAADADHAALGFWRTHAAGAGAQANAARKALAEERAAAHDLDAAVARAARFKPSERMDRLGALIAGATGFDAWIVAVSDDDRLELAAASPPIALRDFPLARSALASSFRRRRVIARSTGQRARRFPEDQVFPDSWLCLPFATGAIALGSRGRPLPSARAQAEAMIERLAPIVANWVMEAAARRRRTLVQTLALRMFNASEQERARIARDLHDDQSQLLAAAQIALEGGGEEARSIFKQVAETLRARTRELRPATLGSASLGDAIGKELARLKRAGVAARLVGAAVGETSSPAVQQLCFQVVREALSNVIHHARAKSVRITLARTSGVAQVRITDNGRGIAAAPRREGAGLVGLRERLELMGGKLTIQSKPGRTTIVAIIPVIPEPRG